MTDKKYTIRPKGKTEPVFEVVGTLYLDNRYLRARLHEGVGFNTFDAAYWDIEESKPTTLDLLNDCGENAYVASRTDAERFAFAKEGEKWWRIGDCARETAAFRVAEHIENNGLEIIFEGVK